jgi:hypothetical protein
MLEPNLEVIKLAGADIILCDDGLTITRYPDDTEVLARAPHSSWAEQSAIDSYCAQAAELGYGDDVDAMSREHEIAHHVLASVLGQPHSHTMWAVAHGTKDISGAAEEAAVMALQRFARKRRANLVDVARLLAKER